MGRYRIIVARDRPDLLGKLAVIYGQKGEVEIHFDRRRGQPRLDAGDRPERRTAPHRDSLLRQQGFFVVRQPDMATASQ
jgi:hypothetical protein